MITRTHAGLPLLHFELFEPFDELACAVSTRFGPAPGGLGEFNLGPVRGPQRGARSANWRAMAAALGLAGISAQLQVHGCDVLRVDAAPASVCGGDQADASCTAASDLALLGFSADCPLVAVYQPGVAVGVAHASWRCTTGLIVGDLLRRMVAEFGCDGRRMWCAIGPSAGPCCYEVGDDVYEAASRLPDREACFTRPRGPQSRRHFDLWQAAVQQMVEMGVPTGQIQSAGLCTICNDQFYSYRREGQGVGQFGLMIGRRSSEMQETSPPLKRSVTFPRPATEAGR